MVTVIETPRSGAGTDVASSNAARWRIDPTWYEETGLSFDDVVRTRADDACQAKWGTMTEERAPVFDAQTGKMRMETRKERYGEDPLRTIGEHCARMKTYIHRDMPTLEAVFRILLATGNEPMTVEEIRERLVEWCPGGGCQWLLMPMETMERLMQGDRTYGLRAVEASQEAGGTD